MSDAIIHSAALILSLIGLFNLLWYLFCHIACDKDCDDVYTFVITEDMEKLPDKLYTAMLLSRYRPVGEREIYVVADEVPYHTKQLCHSCVENLGRVYFISERELLDLFKNKH